MSAVTIQCPHCDQPLEIDTDIHLGHVIDCPVCENHIRLEPEVQEEAAAEPTPGQEPPAEDAPEEKTPLTPPPSRKKIMMRKTVTQGLTKECPSCGKPSPVLGKFCKHCGKPFPEPKPKPGELHIPVKKKGPGAGFIAGITAGVILLAGFAVMKFTAKDSPKTAPSAPAEPEEIVMEVESTPTPQEEIITQKEAREAREKKEQVISDFAATLASDLESKPPRPTPEAPEPVVPATAPTSENMWGYRVEGDNVIFQYSAAYYNTAMLPDGTMRALSEDKVQDVVIAGSFNGWNTQSPAWKMESDASGSFFLSKPADTFQGLQQQPFKFVVNGEIWVGAPEEASNKLPVDGSPVTYNLVLFP